MLSDDPAASFTVNRHGDTVYNAERAEVIKAALMAGARRFARNTTGHDILDYRFNEDHQTQNGLDRRYGAGQLDVYSSYFIIAGGEQNSLEDDPQAGVIGVRGFDYDPHFGGSGCNGSATYAFTPDSDHNLLTTALVWHISIDGGTRFSFCADATLYDLDLVLYDQSQGEIVAASTSTQNNTENLHVALVPGHAYQLRVIPGNNQAAFKWDYALAWQMTPDADSDTIPDDLDNCLLTANRRQVDADNDGYGNRCDADFDNDGAVGINDFNYLIEHWLGSDPAADLDSDGTVGISDFNLFQTRWLQSAPFH
jgi:hypothetical protein